MNGKLILYRINLHIAYIFYYMKKENSKKKWKIVFSEDVLKKFKDLPDDIADEFEKLILGFKTGKIDPTKIGSPIDWVELDVKLKCLECESENVEWLLDKNSDEVTFHCLKCNEGFWMTFDKYKRVVKKSTRCN